MRGAGGEAADGYAGGGLREVRVAHPRAPGAR